jgi:hypothetical protein
MGWVVNATPRPLYSPGTHCTGGWVGPMAVLDGCGKCRLHRDSIPGPSLLAFSRNQKLITAFMTAIGPYPRPVAGGWRWGAKVAMHPRGICKMSMTNMLTSPLKSVRNPTASACCLCCTVVGGNNSFSKILRFVQRWRNRERYVIKVQFCGPDKGAF